MILVDGEKYACQQCIRGHRSSTCKHIKRPLVLVRSRGRPLTDSFQRIAIFAEEIKDEDEKKKMLVREKNSGSNLLAAKRVVKSESSCCSGEKSVSSSPPKSCCAKKESSSSETSEKTVCPCCVAGNDLTTCKKHSSPVYVLKASKRQVFNVEKDSLRLLDPVAEIPNSKVGLDIIQKVFKNKKLHSCNDKRIKEELIHSVVCPTKHTPNSSCCSNKNVTELKKLTLGKQKSPPDAGNTPFVYQFQVSMNKPSKSSSNKRPESKIAQNQISTYPNVVSNMGRSNLANVEKADARPIGFEYPNNVNAPNMYQFQSSPASAVSPNFNNASTEVSNSVLPDISNGLLYDLYIADSCTVPGSCSCEPDKCACPDCSEHRKYRNSNLTIKQQFEEYPFPINEIPGEVNNMANKEMNGIRPYGKVEMHQSSIPLFEQSFLKVLNSHKNENNSPPRQEESLRGDSSQNTDMEDCYCEPDQCCCYNCIQHGIINGIRISDGTCIAEGGGSTPNEIQLLAFQFPPYANSPVPSSHSTPTVLSATESDEILGNTLASNITDARMSNSTSNNLEATALPDKEQWMRYHNSSLYANHIDVAQNMQESNGYRPFIPANISLDGKMNSQTDSINSQDELISTLLNHQQ